MLALLIAASLAGAGTDQPQALAEARHAIAAGRLDQARQMIAEAIAAGASGEAVDQLLAELAYESKASAEALVRYEALAARSPATALFAERAGISALRLGDVAKAAALLDRATSSPSASWRAWNGRGVVADFAGDWATADRAYANAARLNANSAEVANNRGWSLLLRGRWKDAIKPLEQAADRDPKSRRIANNLELARAALAEGLPRRRRGESESDWAARLNDAGVMARLHGDNRRAISAFAQAIEARDQWFERAANNLAALEQAK